MGGHCLAEMYLRENEFADVMANTKAMSKMQSEAILQMAVLYFNKEDYNALAKDMIRKFMPSPFDLEIPIARLFYDQLIDLERDKDFLIEVMNSDLSRRMVYGFVRYLEKESKSVVDYKDIILSMSHHLIEKGGKTAGGWGVEDEISKLVIGLYDETSESTLPEMREIAGECLDIWDRMFEKQIGPIRQLSQELMER